MANMELITSVTVGSGGAASVTLPATGTIPQTYTDLKIVASVRGAYNGVNQSYNITFNGSSTTGITFKRLYGSGSAVASDTTINLEGDGSTATASTFSNDEIYIPNYTSSNYKSFSIDNVLENNATTAYQLLSAGLWSNTAAITTIVLTAIGAGGSFSQGSTFYLYGISNVTSGSKATGGIVSSDGTYWYHTFPFSGTFTPTQALTADYLVIAGGGSGSGVNGGGGAGGLRSTVGATGGGGSLESALSLTAQAYTVTVGAGGAGGANISTQGTNGSNSVFSTITATGGGGGGKYGDPTGSAGSSGGSGGGGGFSQTRINSTSGGAGTSSQGYAGGAGNGFSSGGGGGAGAVGGAGIDASLTGGNGGAGVQISSIANATQTGVNGYYAGGGAAGSESSIPGTGGAGGGGNGGNKTANINPTAGVANTGGGGGGGTNNPNLGAAGGSGIVVIRYAI